MYAPPYMLGAASSVHCCTYFCIGVLLTFAVPTEFGSLCTPPPPPGPLSAPSHYQSVIPPP